MSDDLEFYGGVYIRLDDDGCIQFVDQEQEYECTFDAEEWDKMVDHIHEERSRRMH